MRAAIIRKSDNIVENVIVLEHIAEWNDPDYLAVESDVANPGDLYSNGEFIAQ